MASRKLTMSRCPSRARSSSSRLRMVSWHPSHEVKLKTPILGFMNRFLRLSGLFPLGPSKRLGDLLDLAVAEDRPLLADVDPVHLAVAALPQAAAHAALE